MKTIKIHSFSRQRPTLIRVTKLRKTRTHQKNPVSCIRRLILKPLKKDTNGNGHARPLKATNGNGHASPPKATNGNGQAHPPKATNGNGHVRSLLEPATDRFSTYRNAPSHPASRL